MMGYKWFLQSRMVWGLVFWALGHFGFAVPEEMREQLQSSVVQTVNDLVSTVGLIVAVYGARKAEKNLTVLPWRKGL